MQLMILQIDASWDRNQKTFDQWFGKIFDRLHEITKWALNIKKRGSEEGSFIVLLDLESAIFLKKLS